MQPEEFTLFVHERGTALFRDMPWRRDTDAYNILVSEIMLQQTQVDRVLPKFEAFMARFPNVAALASSPLSDVLVLWSGLGYNRRAKFLHEAAKMIVREFEGELPSSQAELTRLPGVGVNTAGAIVTYAFNRPVVYIETNVRTVYLQHFFENNSDVSDAMIREKVEVTLDRNEPRLFYWALMDYGSWLKRNGVKNIARSKHYRKQAPLEGSVRQVRGRIVRALTLGECSLDALQKAVDSGDGRFEKAYEQLLLERLIQQQGEQVRLTQ